MKTFNFHLKQQRYQCNHKDSNSRGFGGQLKDELFSCLATSDSVLKSLIGLQLDTPIYRMYQRKVDVDMLNAVKSVGFLCVGVAVKRRMYQHKVGVDMLNAVKSVLTDVLSVSPSSEQSRPKLVLTGTSIPLHLQ